MTQVKWADIEGYEGLYKVSNTGLVLQCSNNKLKTLTTSYKGYKKVGLYKNKTQINKFVHRLVANEFVDNPFEKPCINHKDAVKGNNNAKNLEWCTNAENNAHANTNKLVPPRKGSLNGRALLLEQDVADIRLFYKKGLRLVDILKVYPVSHSTLSNIVKFRTWRHL